MEVSGTFVAYAQQLPGQHNHLLPAKNGPKPSHNDYLALALAKQETCTLLTGARLLLHHQRAAWAISRTTAGKSRSSARCGW